MIMYEYHNKKIKKFPNPAFVKYNLKRKSGESINSNETTQEMHILEEKRH